MRRPPRSSAISATAVIGILALSLDCGDGDGGGLDFAITVPGTGDLCAPPPDGYTPLTMNGECLDTGIDCVFGVDCCSGLCVPFGDQQAKCSTIAYGSETCEPLGPDWFAAARPTCDGGFASYCGPYTGSTLGQHTHCGCWSNENCNPCPWFDDPHCTDDYCYVPAGAPYGMCVPYCVDYCAPGLDCALWSKTDPVALCVPTTIPTSPQSAGQVVPSTACTGGFTLGLPTDGPSQNVAIDCCLTIEGDGTMTDQCEFESFGAQELRFVLCHMTDMRHGKGCGGMAFDETAPGFNLWNSEGTLECEEISNSLGKRSSYHFGCREIEVPADGSAIHVFTSDAVYQPPTLRDVYAWDFQINYADVWNLTDEPGVSLDAASCQGVIDQGTWLVPEEVPEVALWWATNEPFIDPFTRYQSADTMQSGPVQHVYFDDLPCAPAGLETTALRTCPARPVETSMGVDLNLFWWRSHLVGSTDEVFPTVIQLQLAGDTTGVRAQTYPPVGETFEIAARQEALGTLRLCDAAQLDTCVPPPVPEGGAITVEAIFEEAGTNTEQFRQVINFVQDRVPPVVDAVDRLERVSGRVEIELRATDATTSPVHVDLWHSADGERWQPHTLTPDPGVLDPATTRTFTGSVAAGSGDALLVTVQDAVANVTVFGPLAVP